MTSLLKKENIKLLSNTKKQFDLHSNLSLISKVIKGIISDSDSDDEQSIEAIPLQFSNSHIQLLKRYIDYLLERSYDWNFDNKTVEFYIEKFNKYDKGDPHWMVKRFVEILLPKECIKLYEISKYLDIKLLQEELIKVNLKNLIESYKYNIEELEIQKNKCEYNINEITTIKKDFKKENKIETIYEDDEEEQEDDEEEQEKQEEQEEKEEDTKKIKLNPLDSAMNQFNQNSESFQKVLSDYYNRKIKLFDDNIELFSNKKQELQNKLNQIKTEIQQKCNEYINNTDNFFFVGNAHFCPECLEIWYLSDIEKIWENSNINDCQQCGDELEHIEEVMFNLKSVLIKIGFDTTEDKEDYLAPEIEDFTNVQHVYDDLQNYNDLFEFHDTCLDCFCNNRTMIKCGDNQNFLSDINNKCCGEKSCQEHFGEGEYVCCHPDCTETIHMCSGCYTSEEHINSTPWEGYTSVCMHCHDVNCAEHMRGKYCEQCSWRHGRDYY